MKLNGVSAVVSGGASGLGEAAARDLAANGATVVIADLNEDKGKTIAQQIGGIFVDTDVSDEARVGAAVQAAVDTGAPVRVIVSCAGISPMERTVDRDGSPHGITRFQKVITVNLIGTFNLMRIGAAAIARTDPADEDGLRGVVINTASIAAFEGPAGGVAYAASKSGILGMTVPAARDLSVFGIRVNTICPGIINTPIYGDGERAEELKRKLLAAPVAFPKRPGTPGEFAHLVRMLIENNYMNGETIRLDGGIRLRAELRV